MHSTERGHIVVPVDADGAAAAAFDRACQAARASQSRITLLYVAPPQPDAGTLGLDSIGLLHHVVAGGASPHGPVASLAQQHRKRAIAIADALAARAASAGLPVEIVERTGLVADAIVRFAREQRATLVVIGINGPPAGRRSVWQRMAGSVAAQLNCPVMLVPEPGDEPARDAFQPAGMALLPAG